MKTPDNFLNCHLIKKGVMLAEFLDDNKHWITNLKTIHSQLNNHFNKLFTFGHPE